MTEIVELLSTFEKLEQYIKNQIKNNNHASAAFLYEDICLVVETVADFLETSNADDIPQFDCEDISVFEDSQRLEQFVNRLSTWRALVLHADISPHENNPQSATTSIKINNSQDSLFQVLVDKLKSLSADELFQSIKERFLQCPPDIQKRIEDYLSKYPFWGSLCVAENNFESIELKAASLHEHLQDYIWLYSRLMDYRSKAVLLATLRNWMYYDFSLLENVKDGLFDDYFDLDLIPKAEQEVFVDLGAYIGDSTANFINTYGKQCFKRIYCYEITPSSFATLQKNLGSIPNIVLIQKGAGAERGTLFISLNSDDDSSSNTLASNGDTEVNIVSIDEDISEPVTIIKMDIEGAEQSALLGCANHIRQSHPKLLISVYHNNEDIWKIARMIDEICPGYQFYLRYHGGNLTPSETTLLAFYQNENCSSNELDLLDKNDSIIESNKNISPNNTQINKYLDYPCEVTIETCGACNANCVFCPHEQLERKNVNMTEEMFSQILNQLEEIPTEHIFLLSPFKVNEMLMDKQIFNKIKQINDRLPNAFIRIFSNFNLATEHDIEQICRIQNIWDINISLNSLDAEEYHKVMHLDLESTLSNLFMFLKYIRQNGLKMKRPKITFSRVSLTPESNQRYLTSFVSIFKDYLDLVEPAIYTRGEWIDHMPSKTPLRQDVKCGRWNEINICCTGEVAFCCMDGKAEYGLGNVMENTILEIYNQPTYRQLRTEDIYKRDVSPCRYCSL